ncbi:WhiB family transcriptional regulator [Serinicoccus sediminis]|uniref:WhiB family transcriptional regulator n=1 Tax=Serinicoccus sediminis TaxID=2306021 RepID=UPI001EDF2FB3|nr:WhiB family transcriptional regulator [Serinicoccus sediminis]
MTTSTRPQQQRHQEGTTVHPPARPDDEAAQRHLGPRLVLDRAALPCHEHPADLWFAELPAEVEHAKELCGPCPLREQCLTGALERREPWGVWGGQLLLQGRVVPRKRPRGRPRKDEVAA